MVEEKEAVIEHTGDSRRELVFEALDDVSHIRIVDALPQRIRYLYFEHSIQGELYLDRVSDPVLEYIGLMLEGMAYWKQDIHSMCMGGLGAAGLYHASRARWGRDFQLDIIENDSRMVELAQNYFQFPKQEPVILNDFRAYCERTSQRYDSIFVDCYSSTSIPPHLMTTEFMQALKALLRPGGVISFNLWSAEANSIWREQLKTIYTVFHSTALVQCPDDQNLIVYASNANLITPDAPFCWKGKHYPVRMLKPAKKHFFHVILNEVEVIRDHNLAALLEQHALSM